MNKFSIIKAAMMVQSLLSFLSLEKGKRCDKMRKV